MTLQEYLDERTISVNSFAKEAKVSRAIIYRYLKTHKKLMRFTAVKLHNATSGKVSLSELGHP